MADQESTLKLISPETEARLRREVVRVPEHCQDGLLDYILYGLPPGSFLQAVLSNDLAEACSRADDTNQRALYDYIFVLYNYAPQAAWGSPLKVRHWIEAGLKLRCREVDV